MFPFIDISKLKVLENSFPNNKVLFKLLIVYMQLIRPKISVFPFGFSSFDESLDDFGDIIIIIIIIIINIITRNIDIPAINHFLFLLKKDFLSKPIDELKSLIIIFSSSSIFSDK